MSRTFSGTNPAVILRRLRGRFGISAPQVAVRTQIPWYLRMIGIMAIVGVSFSLAGWTYDFGRRMAGFDQSEAGAIVSDLRQTNTSLEEEVSRLRSLLTASENSLQIEQAAGKQLTEKNGALVAENAKLKEELAVYERLSKLEGQTGEEIQLDHLLVKADGAGAYRFSFLIALQGTRRGKESKFNLQIVATPRESATGAKIIIPQSDDDPGASQYEIVLRNFRRIEGRFTVPPGVVVGSVEIRILEAGLVKGSMRLTL